MRQLFSPDGMAALAAVMARRPLLAFDFDGTLAKIVARPQDARVPSTVTRRLGRLADMLPLAIVSGRAVADVRARLDFTPWFIIGSHGAEDPLDPGPATRAAVFDRVRDRLGECRTELERSGVLVEDKVHSIALHYRLARDRRRAVELIRQVATGFGPEVRVCDGKMVVNVVAAQGPDKADAVAALVKRCGAHGVVFAGDDVNDEPVFVRADASWLTIRVGCDDSHSRAKFCIDSPGEVATMLDRMLLLLDGLEGSTQ